LLDAVRDPTVARTIGWVAQAIEQYASDAIIRPRAKYVGKVPYLQ
jgi:citrate synthase